MKQAIHLPYLTNFIDDIHFQVSEKFANKLDHELIKFKGTLK